MKNIVICWSDISGYMSTCWRALSNTPEFNVHVIAFRPLQGTNAAFDPSAIMHGISHDLLDDQQRTDSIFVSNLVEKRSPDVIVICGWFHRPYVNLTKNPAFSRIKYYVGIDTPWRGDWRQHLARYLLRPYLKRVSGLIVAGERAWQYANRLGVAKDRIFRGMYGIDFKQFQNSYTARLTQNKEWPRRFLFMGRYENAKAIDVLVQAYQLYRKKVSQPWELTCCGRGSDAAMMKNVDGLTDRGFIQPIDQPTLLAEHGAFLLASRYDPWPLVLVEACAAGLPIVCSESCGSAVEVVRSGYNGFRVPTESHGAFADAMVEIHRNHEHLPEWGRRSQQFAAAHDAEIWAKYWHDWILKP